MYHLNHVQNDEVGGSDAFIKRASGRYYTGGCVGQRLAGEVADAYHQAFPEADTLKVIDPFGGDARLIDWLISSWAAKGFPKVNWLVSIWDLHEIGFPQAKALLEGTASRLGLNVTLEMRKVDSFLEVDLWKGHYDIVLTNPPWELLKPDRRELDGLPKTLRVSYLAKMREYDNLLSNAYPLSRPRRRFAGWGTNLSRVGLEASLRLARKEGIVASVLPASILADDQSGELRGHLLKCHAILDLAYYPAEAKLYDKADVESITLVIGVQHPPKGSVSIMAHDGVQGGSELSKLRLDLNVLQRVDYVLPVSFGAKALKLLQRIAGQFSTWDNLEKDAIAGFWAGREIDETRIANDFVLKPVDLPLFVKGRMIERYQLRERPSIGIRRNGWNPPVSVGHPRLAWRDVSRPNQKRRVIATLIEHGWVAGNSLGVAFFLDDDPTALRAMLGIMNSTVFEFQLRAYLATGHVSLSSLRKVAVPKFEVLKTEKELARLVSNSMNGNEQSIVLADAYVAKTIYNLTEDDYRTILELFPKFTEKERAGMLEAFRALNQHPKTKPRKAIQEEGN
jgi:Alw26I/Eco31I/Esp3I family type II restriction m6 adenine DNA methyltransferase